MFDFCTDPNWIREILTGMSTGQKMERRESLNPTISQSKKDVWQSWTIGIRMVLHGTIWNVKISCHLFVKGRFHSENMNFYDDCCRNLFVCNTRDKMQYTQYPIIRNGLIRNTSEIWVNFKKLQRSPLITVSYNRILRVLKGGFYSGVLLM